MMGQASGRAGRARATGRRGLGFGGRLAAVALVSVLAACTSEASGKDTAARGSTSTTTSTTVPPSTALDHTQNPPAELSFAAYQQALAEADRATVATLTTLASAGSYSALDSQMTQAADTVGDAAARLEDLDPPAHLRDQHAALARGLGGLAATLADLGGQVADQRLCAAPAVLSVLRDLPVTREIRAATHAFNAAGGGRVTLVPSLGGPRPQRPGNGQHLRPKETSGQGVLVIDNRGVGRDAVATLKRGNSVVLSVYVRGNSVARVAGIGDAGYHLYFSHGRDWIPQLRILSRDCEFARFDDPFTFETRVTTQETATHIITTTHFTEQTAFLMPTPAGNAPTTPVTPDEFPT